MESFLFLLTKSCQSRRSLNKTCSCSLLVMMQVLIYYTCCCLMCDVAFDVVANTAANGDVAIVVVSAAKVFVVGNDYA